jgi:hypothetical protein
MIYSAKWRLAASAMLAAAVMVGCRGGGANGEPQTSTPTPPAAPQTTAFSTFTKAVFAESADSTPQSLDNVTFDFDVDDDPTAFDGLLT